MRGTIEEADVMIKSLDDCVAELEAGIATVEKWPFHPVLWIFLD